MRANSFVFPLKRLEFFVALVDLLPVFPENCFPVTGKLAGKRETHPGNFWEMESQPKTFYSVSRKAEIFETCVGLGSWF
jgi:hypothetical protein